jgi:heat shock protein HtpX
MSLVNIGIIITLSILFQITGLNRYLYESGFNYASLFIFCLVWGMGGAFISLFLSKSIVKWSMGVKVIPFGQGDVTALKLQKILLRISEKAQLKKIPEFGIYESPEMNAFATGPSESRALVAVSTGLIHNMSDDEIEGVLAHEVTHIKNGDMVTMTLLQGIVNALVMFLARIIAFVVANNVGRDGQRYWLRYMVMIACEMILGFFGIFVTAWFSRRREFRADAGGAKYSSPQKMLLALEALKRRFQPLDNRAPQLAAFKISTGRERGFLSLAASHPSLEERIQALRAALFV